MVIKQRYLDDATMWTMGRLDDEEGHVDHGRIEGERGKAGDDWIGRR
jgi:hypothetical protein